MNGWMGKILRVDLTKGRIVTEDLNPDLAKEFIGGRGLASKVLFDEVDPQVDALSPENKLIFSTGPLTGTGAVTSSRYMVATKSPLTGAIACSNSGGYFGPELKFAGYDLIILEGRSDNPVYLWIEDDRVELRRAEHLWGKDTSQTEDLIRAETHKRAKIACIGPAGEKLVRIAAVMNDKNRAAARSGVGAVMGSKKLKALAVKGSKKVGIADRKAFKEANMLVLEKLKSAPPTAEGLPNLGTAMGVNFFNELHLLPTRNFQEGFLGKAEKISGEAIAQSIFVKKKACYACPIGCGRVTKVNDPEFQGEGEGPEYETIAALGSNCGIDNLAAITKANYYCNELGLDTISAGVTIAGAMELYERGILSEREVGFKLNFGNAQALVELIKKMGLREDFGDILAEGGYRMAEKYGHPELFMGVKGQELPGFQVRGLQGSGLAFATSNRGACHLRAGIYGPELFGIPEKIDPLDTKDKALWVKKLQDSGAVIDSSGICVFIAFGGVGLEEVLGMLEAATGAGYNMEGILLTGEMIWNLERLFNQAAGLTGKDDNLPLRMLKEPMPEGPYKGQVVRLDEMIPEYYRLRGWDKDGNPTPEKLEGLGL